MNKKGFTLVELIVAIALLSIIMLFLYDFLADVSFEQDDDAFASLNQEQRIEIIEYALENLSDNEVAFVSGSKICFTNLHSICGNDTLNCTPTITTNNCSDYIEITKKGSSRSYNMLSVYKNNELKRSWTIKNAFFGNNNYCNNKLLTDLEGATVVDCSIKVYTDNIFNQENIADVNNNNTIDDITITYMHKPVR